ncbi:hypothetical protein NDU88_006623 [Pleurodeles waltl]|uniref:Uncharacterized protein n=1 Tax=Pleurodeles waltl TaxID=8319 RepID=A0AAV7TYV5_PLEWA|nr:hypothetical protein NDU88_006623 [Pleurodeles waltl]
MLRMDAVDQAIVSLKLQPPGVTAEQVERRRRVWVPSKEALPPVPKRAHVQGRRKGDLRGQAEDDPGTPGVQGTNSLEVAQGGQTPAPGNSGQAAVKGNVTAVMGLAAAHSIVQNGGGGMAIGVTSMGSLPSHT